MYFDLFLPFPLVDQPEQSKKKKDKGKSKAQTATNVGRSVRVEEVNPWDGLEEREKDGFSRDLALAGHLGYSVVGCAVLGEPSNVLLPSPFRSQLPFPLLDPRKSRQISASSSSSALPNGGGPSSSEEKLGSPIMVQVTRYHMRLDDNKVHCLINANTAVLKDYDILSVQPTSEKAFQLACTDLSAPGPNQLSIITLPLHERPYHFRLNRKQVKQAQRNGVMFEILYSPGLFPPPSTPPDAARRYRQNFLSNTREIIRITGGKGLIFSSGPGGSIDGKRGPLDVVNLGTMLGMPANLAKDAISANPKKVLLNAQARRTFKAIFSAPKMIPPPGPSMTNGTSDPAKEGKGSISSMTITSDSGKRHSDGQDAVNGNVKKAKIRS